MGEWGGISHMDDVSRRHNVVDDACNDGAAGAASTSWRRLRGGERIISDDTDDINRSSNDESFESFASKLYSFFEYSLFLGVVPSDICAN